MTDVGDVEREGLENTEDGEDEDEDEDEYGPKRKATKPRKQTETPEKLPTKPKTSTVKKPRGPKPKGTNATRKTKPDASIDIVKLIKDSHISDDNTLFSMLQIFVFT